jgi:hypothetical protein
MYPDQPVKQRLAMRLHITINPSSTYNLHTPVLLKPVLVALVLVATLGSMI